MSISAKKIRFTYDNSRFAVDSASLRLESGQLIAIAGANGSGKSTFARILAGLMMPSEGSVLIDDFDIGDESKVFDIRQRVGMVFQNPENQIVATIVENDVAFAPENLSVPPAEIENRVKYALSVVGLEGKAHSAPHMLSGGQKQRLAIAGILAMKPKYIILDEPTSMLDPGGRNDIMGILLKMVKEEGVGAILITHFMEEVLPADRVMVLSSGKVVFDDKPTKLFEQADKLESWGLEAPWLYSFTRELNKKYKGQFDPHDSLEKIVDKMAALGLISAKLAPDSPQSPALPSSSPGPVPNPSLAPLAQNSPQSPASTSSSPGPVPNPSLAPLAQNSPQSPAPLSNPSLAPLAQNSPPDDAAMAKLEIKNEKGPQLNQVIDEEDGANWDEKNHDGFSARIRGLSYVYKRKTPFETRALRDISLDIPKAGITAIIGSTGSGKTTLISHFNALIRPQTGKLRILDHNLHSKTNYKALRAKVGMVFQNPEDQIFEETVESEIAFGPKNILMPQEEIEKNTINSMLQVGLKPEKYLNRSPFALSGGEKRRVAIASVLAMNPRLIIFDEPTSGLDPAGRMMIEDLLLELSAKKTVYIVTHQLDLVARIADFCVVLGNGNVLIQGKVSDVFQDEDKFLSAGLKLPEQVQFLHKAQMKLDKKNVKLTQSPEKLLGTLIKEKGKKWNH